jgi:hypothetical protein
MIITDAFFFVRFDGFSGTRTSIFFFYILVTNILLPHTKHTQTNTTVFTGYFFFDSNMFQPVPTCFVGDVAGRTTARQLWPTSRAPLPPDVPSIQTRKSRNGGCTGGHATISVRE